MHAQQSQLWNSSGLTYMAMRVSLLSFTQKLPQLLSLLQIKISIKKKGKKYIRNKALVQWVWSTQLKSQLFIHGTDTDKTFEKQAELACIHACFLMQPFPNLVSSATQGVSFHSKLVLSPHYFPPIAVELHGFSTIKYVNFLHLHEKKMHDQK